MKFFSIEMSDMSAVRELAYTAVKHEVDRVEKKNIKRHERW